MLSECNAGLNCCGGEGRKNLRLQCRSKKVLVRLMGSLTQSDPAEESWLSPRNRPAFASLSRLGGVAGGTHGLSSNTVRDVRMRQSVQAAIPVHYRLTGLHNRDLFLMVLEAGKSKTRPGNVGFILRLLLLACRQLSSNCSHDLFFVWRERALSCLFL